jgi:hypothetical protein
MCCLGAHPTHTDADTVLIIITILKCSRIQNLMPFKVHKTFIFRIQPCDMHIMSPCERHFFAVKRWPEFCFEMMSSHYGLQLTLLL